MKRLAFLLTILAAAPLQAQDAIRPPQGWGLAIFAGGSAYTDFHRGTIHTLAESPTGDPRPFEFDRRIGAKTSGAFAAAVSYWPSNSWGLRLFASYSPSRFKTMVPQEAIDMVETLEASDTGPWAGLSITSYEAQGMIRLPTIARKLMPYGFAGVGVVRYSAENETLPEEAEPDFATGPRAKPAVRLGIGAHLPMRPAGLALTFELSDQIASTPMRADGDRNVTLTNAVSFMVGASWTLSPRR